MVWESVEPRQAQVEERTPRFIEGMAELARNGGRQRYRAVDAQARADAARSRPKLPALASSPALAAHGTGRGACSTLFPFPV